MWYFLCFMAGGLLGFLGAALLCAAGKADEIAEDLTRNS